MVSKDDLMGEAEIDLQTMINAAAAIGDPELLGDIQIGRWLKSEDNALVRDSAVVVSGGKVKQGVALKLPQRLLEERAAMPRRREPCNGRGGVGDAAALQHRVYGAHRVVLHRWRLDEKRAGGNHRPRIFTLRRRLEARGHARIHAASDVVEDGAARTDARRPQRR